MKKFIAMIVALSMVASIGLTCVLAAEPNFLTITCTPEKLSSEQSAAMFSGLTGSFVGYSLTFNIEGIEGDELSWTRGGSKGAYTYDGRSIDAAELNLVSNVNKTNFLRAFTDEDAALSTEDDVISTTRDALVISAAGNRLIPAGSKSGTFDATEDALVVFYVAIPEDLEVQFTPDGVIEIWDWDSEAASPSTLSGAYTNQNHNTSLRFSPATITIGEAAAPATVDVTSVTISGDTAATVGDNVQLSATVLPDNATDKTVTWSKVSGNGDVSDSGVVTATAAGDVVVKATAGGVDSANYTVSFAAPAPTPVYTDSSIVVKKPVSGTTGLTDLQGKDVTLTANYGIAKFSKDIDIVANKYFVVATDSNDVEREFEVDFAAKGVEISNVSTTFFAIVKSADHIIKSIRLKEIAR